MIDILAWMLFIPTGIWTAATMVVAFGLFITGEFYFWPKKDVPGVIVPMIIFFLTGTYLFGL